MTLITYLTRVHFADGILEEALRSELEVNNKQCPFIIVDKLSGLARGDLLDRVYEGLPNRRNAELFEFNGDRPTEAVVENIANKYRENNCDILIALGSNTIIDLAKLCRISLGHGESLTRFTISEGGSRRIGEMPLPDLYAVPNIDGFCSSVSAHAKLIHKDGTHARVMCRKLVPNVTICDPTLTSDTDPSSTASASVDAISRCMEAYLSPNYNPPADGIAFDGLRRAIKYLPNVMEGEDPVARRELMAASLNSALALQKGLGTTQVIGDSLEEECGQKLDLGTIRKILLPRILQENTNTTNEKMQALANLLGWNENKSVSENLENFFSVLPLASGLSKLGIDYDKVKNSAETAATAMLVAPGLEALDSKLIETMMLEKM